MRAEYCWIGDSHWAATPPKNTGAPECNTVLMITHFKHFTYMKQTVCNVSSMNLINFNWGSHLVHAA